MAETCKNCEELIEKNFCANCGQKKYKRIDRKYILDEIQYTFLHANKGLLYSVKNILKNPGKTARNFVEGNRVNHYKPILLVFVLTGLSTFISYKLLGTEEIINTGATSNYTNAKMKYEVTHFMQSYLPFLMILMIPFFALTTKIAFRKWGHNFYEHVVMNAFIAVYYTLMNLVFITPILLFLNSDPIVSMYFALSTYILIIPLLLWFFKGFYKDRPTKSIVFRVFAVFGLVISGVILLGIVIMVLGFIAAMILGPEVMQQFMNPK